MKLFIRLFWLILTQSRRSRCSLLGPVTSTFRVWPNDLDVLMHMNNGVYLTLMDLGRTDLLLRSEAFHLVRKKGWYPVLAGETIRFKRSLKLWQKFDIVTRVVGWNEKSVYLEQRFVRNQQTVALAVVDARFLQRGGGKVTPQQVMALLGIDDPAPELPEWVAMWVQSNQTLPLDVKIDKPA